MTDTELEEVVKQLAGKKYWSIAHHRQNLGFPCKTTEVVVISIGKLGVPFENYVVAGDSNALALEAITKEIKDAAE